MERDHLGDPGVDGRIIFRRIFSKWDVVVWTGSSWLSTGRGGGRGGRRRRRWEDNIKMDLQEVG
jgi:hypothetical protein